MENYDKYRPPSSTHVFRAFRAFRMSMLVRQIIFCYFACSTLIPDQGKESKTQDKKQNEIETGHRQEIYKEFYEIWQVITFRHSEADFRHSRRSRCCHKSQITSFCRSLTRLGCFRLPNVLAEWSWQLRAPGGKEVHVMENESRVNEEESW